MIKHLKQLFLLLLSFNVASAQETTKPDSIAQLKEVIITYQANKTTPVSFQNISSTAINAKSTGQEPSFLLAETPAVTVYSDAGNAQGYSYFRMRGIDQTRINITLDGVPLNEPEDQGAYFSNYPDVLNSVSKIQVQRGVGTSQNGVASYGGSVQLFSPNLSDSAGTSIGADYGSFNSFRLYAEHNTGIKKGKALYVRASQIKSDGYKYNSANNSRSVFLSGGLFFKKSIWKLNVLAGQQKNQLAWLGVTDSLINIDRKINANKNERDRFFQSLVQIANRWQLTKSSLLQSGMYYTFLKGNYDFNLNHFLGLPTTAELYNYAFQSNLVGLFSNYSFSRKHFNLTTGAHANMYNRRHNGSENTIGPLYENTGYKNEMAIFTKADYKYNKFTFFADIQYRSATFDYKGSVPLQKINWNFLNPKAGVSLEPANNPCCLLQHRKNQQGANKKRPVCRQRRLVCRQFGQCNHC